MRLNYSFASNDQIKVGIERLSHVIKNVISENTGGIAEDFVSIP